MTWHLTVFAFTGPAPFSSAQHSSFHRFTFTAFYYFKITCTAVSTSTRRPYSHYILILAAISYLSFSLHTQASTHECEANVNVCCVAVNALLLVFMCRFISFSACESVCLSGCSVGVRLTHTHTHIDAGNLFVQTICSSIWLATRNNRAFKYTFIYGYLKLVRLCALWTTIICILLCITTHHIQSPYYWIMNKFYKWSTKRTEMGWRTGESKMEH